MLQYFQLRMDEFEERVRINEFDTQKMMACMCVCRGMVHDWLDTDAKQSNVGWLSYRLFALSLSLTGIKVVNPSSSRRRRNFPAHLLPKLLALSHEPWCWVCTVCRDCLVCISLQLANIELKQKLLG